jgi:hypothetical protein
VKLLPEFQFLPDKEKIIMGTVYNRSSQDVWVVESDGGLPFAHVLAPNRKSPSNVDADGVKGKSSTIDGHPSWWKISDGVIASIYNQGTELHIAISGAPAYVVGENQFGPVIYNYNSGWGESYGQPPCLATQILVDGIGLPDNGNEMNTLREFRNYLHTSNQGSLLVNEYEATSTLFTYLLSKHQEKDKIVKEIAYPIVMELVDAINKKETRKAVAVWRKLRSSLEDNLQPFD